MKITYAIDTKLNILINIMRPHLFNDIEIDKILNNTDPKIPRLNSMYENMIKPNLLILISLVGLFTYFYIQYHLNQKVNKKNKKKKNKKQIQTKKELPTLEEEELSIDEIPEINNDDVLSDFAINDMYYNDVSKKLFHEKSI